MQLRSLLAAALVVAPAVGAQAPDVTQYVGDAQSSPQSTVVVADPSATPPGWQNPRYQAWNPANGVNTQVTGIVNLWFRNAAGTVTSGCTGSLLSNGRILTAAHCVATSASSVRWASFTARFYNQATGTWVDVDGSTFWVHPRYTGAVIESNDVAVLGLSGPPPAFARTYSIFSGPSTTFRGQQTFVGGFGRVGTGLTGDASSSNQFDNGATLRFGYNTFESTGITGGFFANRLSPAPMEFGGVLLSDVDPAGGSSTSFLCGTLGAGTVASFCNTGYGLMEVGLGRGDSGGAAFLASTWEILGVASWGTGSGGNLSQFNQINGHACVANVTGNAQCIDNFNFVAAVPEPSTYALLATGLIGLAGVARRRKNAK